MKYIDITSPGAPEVLQLTEGPAPTPKEGEILVKVTAAGVNRPDVVQRQGGYPPPPGASHIPGLEVSGKVVSIGEGADRWQAGDRVCALVNGGGYAEYVTVPAAQCLPIPDGLDMVEAAALPETCFTVWSNVFDRAGLKAGETLLVHGGTSGIGTTAIQMAHALGGTVFTTAGSDAKCAACRQLGADLAINYKTRDFVNVILEETGKKGVDVILDMVGGEYISRNIKVAAMDGRIVNIAYLNGAKVAVNFMPVMMKRLMLTGATLRPRPTAEKAAIARALEDKVWPLIVSGEIRPVIHETFVLEDAAKAHAIMESSAHIGKLVLLVDNFKQQ